ncbi:uncharacterized protein PGTG_09731 [Puccinia graminis f. sp. tritici CRL 75-36-700-3]|uniref:Uncharacterized protein n=1 Tax=Puccinia graminis f. sp. tritici (strain CRL 75-36-700-3 / race SCCL) TaxID=418459 RepID=E3KI93_PUCGT|nr:uncharacterized protein PGTG_09731 [Puccinia graminis f. sp. tritici CRL 75-36-700-3]EFP84018.1 hypothetical protein PGTG_09731 [Puccinia graminis f. sp. tritici CRL 75-36-700-3]
MCTVVDFFLRGAVPLESGEKEGWVARTGAMPVDAKDICIEIVKQQQQQHRILHCPPSSTLYVENGMDGGVSSHEVDQAGYHPRSRGTPGGEKISKRRPKA